jgi:hypothetical protein
MQKCVGLLQQKDAFKQEDFRPLQIPDSGKQSPTSVVPQLFEEDNYELPIWGGALNVNLMTQRIPSLRHQAGCSLRAEIQQKSSPADSAASSCSSDCSPVNLSVGTFSIQGILQVDNSIQPYIALFVFVNLNTDRVIDSAPVFRQHTFCP